MKPQLTEADGSEVIADAVRARGQLLGEIENRLNGLKLYATFLRRRAEKSERPADEPETIRKLIAGLERAGEDFRILAQYDQSIALRRQPRVDIRKLMRGLSISLREKGRATGDLSHNIVIQAESEPLEGEFDPAVLADALKAISQVALKLKTQGDSRTLRITLRREGAEPDAAAVIEWEVVASDIGKLPGWLLGGDTIRMSFASRIVEAHGGTIEHTEKMLQVRLPLG